MNNEWVIAIVFFVVGLIPAYYFYKRGIRIKEPVYSIKSVNLVSDNVVAYENLAVTYKGGKIANFTVSKVLFFNRGAETLYRENIDTLNHLKLVSKPSSNILDARILQVNNLSSGLQVSLDSTNKGLNEWIIDFDYLNHNQGTVIEVIHTGLSSADIDMVGDMKDVKGLRRIPKNLVRNSSSSESLKRSIGRMAQIFMGLTVLIGSSLFSVTSYRTGLDQPVGLARSLNLGASFLFGFMSIAMILLIIAILLTRSTIIPSGLEMFDE